MPLHERDYFNQKTETKPMSLACPQCRHRDDYQVKWVRYTRKERVPTGGDRGFYDKLRDYMYRIDDTMTCTKCRRRFEIPSHQSTVFLESRPTQFPPMLDAIVVGAGPAGAIAALVMARAGARVVIVDAASSPRAAPCGDLLEPAAVRLLKQLDIWRPMAPMSRRLAAWQLHTPFGGRHRLEVPPGDSLMAVRRSALDTRLLQAAVDAGARFEAGLPVQRVLVDQSTRMVRGVVVGTGAGEWRLPALMVVAADGRHSRAAGSAGLGVADRSGTSAVVAYATGLTGCVNEVETHLDAEADRRLTPVDGDLVNVCVVTRWPLVDDGARVIHKALRRHPALAARSGALELSGVRTSDATGIRTRAVGRPGVLLAGDAAGRAAPWRTDGIYAAMRGGQLAGDEVLRTIETGGFEEAADRLAAARAREPCLHSRSGRLLAALSRHRTLVSAGSVLGRLSPSLLRPWVTGRLRAR